MPEDMEREKIDMQVSTILKLKGAEIYGVAPGTTVADAVAMLRDRGVGALVVTHPGSGRPEGIFSERDVVRGLAEHGAALLSMTVDEHMASPVVTCSLEDTEREVLAMMTERRFRHLPVVEDGVLCGIVSIGDVVKARIDGIVAEADALRAYIAHG
jgi:CBS domain-containing protein